MEHLSIETLGRIVLVILSVLALAGGWFTWRHFSGPTYQCKSCTGVFQTPSATPSCPYCHKADFQLITLGGD